MSFRMVCLGMLASSLGFSQYVKPFDSSQYGKLFQRPVQRPVELRIKPPVETPKVCAIPLLEFKPQIQTRTPVIKPTAPTAPMPKLVPPAPACTDNTPTR